MPSMKTLGSASCLLIACGMTANALPTPAIDYDASNDPDSGVNSTWEDVVGTETGVDLALGTGVSYNGSPTGAPASVDAVYVFDGTSNARALGTSDFDLVDKFSSAASVSVEMLFRADVVNTNQFLWDDGGSGSGISLSVSSAGNLQFAVRNGSSHNAGMSKAISAGQFVHAVGVVDMTGDKVYLYVNGVSAGTADDFAGTSWAGNDGTSGVTTIGDYTNTAGATGGFFGSLGAYGNFDGDIAFVRFYESALTAQDASDLYGAVIPEPSSLALLGLGGLLIARRRRD